MAPLGRSAVAEALLGRENNGQRTRQDVKPNPVADGILSVTPDTPEMLEWRSRSALDVAETSSTFLDDDDDGPKPHELYGKFTWKIENFSEISKRELRSNVFDVGNYKWYILVYPQGCDVCNHLSLFLCVADYDKLLPGWSHFAQFTIAVVNKDPKKSKYSDTLHRFCKKEHDWGWKKFMELSKVLDGFTVADTLVIKAQVQVILDKPSKPFRCLDPQYRRELVRVYLTNVEGICRRFCEDKKARLSWARDEAPSFRHFWGSLTPEQQRKYLTDKGEVILKAVVKQFFNEKEVTSTLVMDALYSGCKQIEEHSRTWLEGKSSDNAPIVLIKAERSTFTLCGDLAEIAERVQKDFIPAAKDDSKALQPNDGLTLRSGQDGDDGRRDSIERDEKRLAELGRRTIEMFVIAHIFCEKLEIAYREAEALKRQDQLIAEEFEMARLEESKAQAKAMADKEKKAKKKEKLKQKKEAEKQKREAEEAERRAREDEARREAERKAKEAEKKRLEEAQTQPQPAGAQQAQVQAQSRKGKQTRDDRRAAQQAQQAQHQHQQAAVAQQQAQQAQGQQSRARQGSSSSGPSGQPQAAAQPQSQAQPQAAAQQAQAGSGRAQPLQQAAPSAASSGWAGSAAAAEAASSGAAAAAAASGGISSHPDRPPLVDASDESESGSEEVGTVNQATGATDSSGEGEEDADGGPSGSSGAGGAGAGALSESESEGRAALEEEVTILRAQVSQLQKLLAERDAEVLALRGQVSELQQHAAATAAGAEAQVAEARAREGAASAALAQAQAAAAAASAGRAGSSGASSGSGAAASDVAATQGREAVAENGPAAAGSAASRPDSERSSGKADHSSANGPKEPGQRPEPIPASAIPAAAASAAAAAVRRLQPVAAAAAAAAAGHDPSAMLHAGVALPARSASGTTQASAATAAAASAGRGGPQHGAEAAAHHASGTGSAAAAASGSGGDQGAPMMQRSTSATLPSAAGPGPYAQLAPHQLAVAPGTANGRARPSGLDAAAGSSGAGKASGAPAPYMPQSVASSAAAAAGSAAAVGGGANGMAGVLHSGSTGSSDGLPSYRNAAAGVLGASGQQASGAAAGPMLAPVSPSQAPGAQGKRLDDSSSSAAAAAAAARQMAAAVNASAADGGFGATSARIMMQQAQRAGLAAFSTPTSVPQSAAAAKQRMGASTQLDSPGLEDFAHINMIDDLLTE
ncbi:hypothetical protein HYH03_009924 [Edaphochlamys debaryana]|uniref:MATH domain-containing protein n=1 Tax=Edaphochlamys debaryana TaxID=47281 RepID=A0A835XX01_9CHLO|nr:hypothetical protein HYH03_009924 [Edaphochlamys debaryana]|eukprot:KAG2491763.1 hypothetical protein HYH03_009924 [Edaphochlamys debaryana]